MVPVAKKKLYFFVMVMCMTGYVWVFLSHYHHLRSESCLLHRITHLPCPSCGSTRSVLALLNGEFAGAFYYNPLGYLILLLMILLPVWVVYDLIRRKESFIRSYKNIESLFRKRCIVIPFILLILSNWIWNFFKYL
jgi:hypothetical protein